MKSPCPICKKPHEHDELCDQITIENDKVKFGGARWGTADYRTEPGEDEAPRQNHKGE